MHEKYRVSTFLAILLVVALVIHFWSAWAVFGAEASEHGQAFSWWGRSGFLVEWIRQLYENIVSEYLQLLTAAMVGAGLLERIGVMDYQQDMEKVKRALGIEEE